MRLPLKTTLFAALVIVSNVAGNLCLSWGMRHDAALPPIAAGVAILIGWALARLTLLSWADLTFVLPVTSLGYVLNVAAGRVFFGEIVTPSRWAGALLIVLGATLVAPTHRRARG
jgi:uncharacterized membrane protein